MHIDVIADKVHTMQHLYVECNVSDLNYLSISKYNNDMISCTVYAHGVFKL